MSNEFLKLLNSLNNVNKKPTQKTSNKSKGEGEGEEDEDKQKIYEFFDVNRLNNEFEKLMNDIDKEISKSIHIENILKIVQSDITILTNIITKITNELIELKINSFDTSLTTLSLSQKLVCQRIVEGCNNIILYNSEKDKNLKEFFNNYASKFIDFNELMHQKGIKILIIDGQNISLPDKKRALLLINQMDTKSDVKDPHPNSNDKAFAFIETTKKTVNILCENTTLIIDEK